MGISLIIILFYHFRGDIQENVRIHFPLPKPATLCQQRVFSIGCIGAGHGELLLTWTTDYSGEVLLNLTHRDGDQNSWTQTPHHSLVMIFSLFFSSCEKMFFFYTELLKQFFFSSLLSLLGKCRKQVEKYKFIFYRLEIFFFSGQLCYWVSYPYALPKEVMGVVYTKQSKHKSTGEKIGFLLSHWQNQTYQRCKTRQGSLQTCRFPVLYWWYLSCMTALQLFFL